MTLLSGDHWKTYLVGLITSYFEKNGIVAIWLLFCGSFFCAQLNCKHTLELWFLMTTDEIMEIWLFLLIGASSEHGI